MSGKHITQPRDRCGGKYRATHNRLREESQTDMAMLETAVRLVWPFENCLPTVLGHYEVMLAAGTPLEIMPSIQAIRFVYRDLTAPKSV